MGQREEIETIKERNIKLNLSDADVQRICEKAGAVGLTVADLLENFIGDLVCGTYSNGSDERRLASEWFERCWFGMFPEYTFLSYLLDWDDVEETIDIWNEIKYYKELEELAEEDKEELEELEENINDKFAEFQGHRKVGEKEVILAEEMENVIKWWNEFKEIENSTLN